MRIAVASDHAGFIQKAPIIEHIRSLGHEVIDLGPATDDRVDYPDFGDKVGRMVARGDADRGVVICGTGLGIAMTADKVPGIRATAIQTVQFAELCREHNDCNVIASPAASCRWSSTSRLSTPSSPPSSAVAVTPAASRRSCARTTPPSRAFPSTSPVRSRRGRPERRV